MTLWVELNSIGVALDGLLKVPFLELIVALGLPLVCLKQSQQTLNTTALHSMTYSFGVRHDTI